MGDAFISVMMWQLLTGRLLQQMLSIPGAHLKTKFADRNFKQFSITVYIQHDSVLVSDVQQSG